jgi:rare lipoprotein A (peptidoglycan hydrolase)
MIMKKIVYAGLLGFVLTFSVFAQQAQPVKADGMGSWYDGGAGLFASHASLPFGTELIVTNLDNGYTVTVQVGGRIPQDRRWIIELSPEASYILDMYEMGFTPVQIEEVVKVAQPKALRTTSVRNFQQSGRAVILASGTDLSAGHPSMSMGRQLQVTNQTNGRRVVVTVNNRVRASTDRIIEISRAAAQALGVSRGTSIDVNVESIDR